MQINGTDILIRVNGINISYDDSGTGGIPILFIHGFPFNKSMWQPQYDFLKKSQRVITYDLRGYGESTSGEEEASIALHADDLIGLLDALEIPQVIACGLSMGGYILLDAINRYPERFKAIILSDSQCIADSPEAKEKRHKTIDQIKSEGTSNFAEGFVKKIFCAASLENKKETVEKIKQVILSTSPETIITTLLALAGRNERCSSLNNISIPTLIICGQEDKVTPLAQSEFMNANIRGSKLKVIGEAGHVSNLEQKEIFNQHLVEFISSLRNDKDG